MWRAVAFLVLLAVTAQAAVIDGTIQTRGVLAQNQTNNNPTANQVDFGATWKGRWIYFESMAVAGSASVAIEVNCAEQGATDFASRWVAVQNSSKTVNAATTVTDAFQIEQPGCQYRGVVSACTGCNIMVRYLAGSEIH